MSSLCILHLARHAGPTFDDLAHDIAAVVRPGDHVITVDDSGPDSALPGQSTAARTTRFLAEHGWGEGVAQTTILTDRAGTGDTGSALNLALQALRHPGARRDRVVVYIAGSRLNRDVFFAARAAVEATDADLALLPWRQWSLEEQRPLDGAEAVDWTPYDSESVADHIRRIAPPLQSFVIRQSLLDALWSEAPQQADATLAMTPPGFADEGRGSDGDLALRWQLLSRAARPLVWGATQHPVGHRPEPPAPGPELVRAATDLIRATADTAQDAGPWILGRLPLWLQAMPPAARATLSGQCLALIEGLPLEQAREIRNMLGSGITAGGGCEAPPPPSR